MIPLATYRFHLNGDDYECIISKEDSPTRHLYLYLCANGVRKVWPSAGSIIQLKVYDKPRRPRRSEQRFYHYNYHHDDQSPHIVFPELEIDLEIPIVIAYELNKLKERDLWVEFKNLTPKQETLE